MVKKLKAPPLRERDLLVGAKPAALAARWQHRASAVDDLFDIIDDHDGWTDHRTPGRAAAVLIDLGHEKEVAMAWLELMAALDELGEYDDDMAAGTIGVALGDHADPAVVGPLLLDVLDAAVIDTGAPLFCWDSVLDPLATFGERGWRDERTWAWLERLRAEDPTLWCVYVNGYGDVRAVPFLETLIDDNDHGLDDVERSAARDMFIEALEARLSLPEPRPVDRARFVRLEALRATLEASQQGL